MNKIPAVKYTRDFYPADMALRQHIEDAWRRAAERAGFEAWDSPIFEHLELYKRKSGDEIVGQLFALETKGGDELAIRPEMTPSLARMIVARQGGLPRPIKWYCIARMCRYERGQKGRLREFWQWNVDVLDVDSLAADAEVISVALDGLIELGLSAAEVEVRLNSRSFFQALLLAVGVTLEQLPAVFAVTDKRGKESTENLRKLYLDAGLTSAVLDRLLGLLECRTLAEVEAYAAGHRLDGHQADLESLHRLFEFLAALGKADYCRFDLGVVRGLAYYTGPVFEIFDRQGDLRAICGGGRYDRLIETMGGQPMPACGFGMGDVTLGLLLEQAGKLPGAAKAVEVQVLPLADDLVPLAMRVAQAFRQRGKSAEYLMKPAGLGKALKRAAEKGIAQVVILGPDEAAQQQAKVRNMASKVEEVVDLARLLEG